MQEFKSPEGSFTWILKDGTYPMVPKQQYRILSLLNFRDRNFDLFSVIMLWTLALVFHFGIEALQEEVWDLVSNFCYMHIFVGLPHGK